MSDGILDTAVSPVPAAAPEPGTEPTPNGNKLTARNLFKKRRLDEHNEAEKNGNSTPSTGSYVMSERDWKNFEPSEHTKRLHQEAIERYNKLPRPEGVPEGVDLGLFGADTYLRGLEAKKKREEDEKFRKEENSRRAREMQEELQKQYAALPDEEKIRRAMRRAALMKRFDDSWAKRLIVPKEPAANGSKSSGAIGQGLSTKRPLDDGPGDPDTAKRQRTDGNAPPGHVAVYEHLEHPPLRQPSQHSRALSWGTDLDDVDERHDQIVHPVDQPIDLSTIFPPSFPAYRESKHINEIGTYLSKARYVVSLGGPPLKDMGYGIIIVPFGEEKMLLSRQDAPPINQSMMELIETERRAHPSDEHHSFVGDAPRPRKKTDKEARHEDAVPLPRTPNPRTPRQTTQTVPHLDEDNESDDVNASRQLLSESKKGDGEEEAPAPPTSRRKTPAKRKAPTPAKKASPPTRRGAKASKASTPKPKREAAAAATSGGVGTTTRRTSARRGKK